MKIKRELLKSFSDNDIRSANVVIPTGSILRKIVALHDGLYAIFEVPELAVNSTTELKFKLLTTEESIPNNSNFVDVIDLVIELPLEEGQTVPRQAVQLIPIYLLN